MTTVVAMLTPERVENILSRLLNKAEPPEAFSRPELTQAYNLAVTRLDRPDSKVKSFKDTKTAVKRVTIVLSELAGGVDNKPRKVPVLPKKPTDGFTDRTGPAADYLSSEAAKPAVNGAAKPEVKEVNIKALPPVTRATAKRLDADKVVKVLKANPHKKGTKDYDSFTKLKDGMTVGKAREVASDPSYLSYAVKRGLVELK